MNEILVLKKIGGPDYDGRFICETGIFDYRDEEHRHACFVEYRRVDRFVKSFLRKTGKSVDEYDSTEEVIKDFLNYCSKLTLEDGNDTKNR